jgi:hypothetical protein
VSWLFFAVFGPLVVASLILCGEDSTFRFRRHPRMEVAREDVGDFWRFLRSREPVPQPRF